jgi:hypothetical protein
MQIRGKKRSKKICANCKKEGSLICSKCRIVYYCDIKCQKSNWNFHKLICASSLSKVEKKKHKSNGKEWKMKLKNNKGSIESFIKNELNLWEIKIENVKHLERINNIILERVANLLHLSIPYFVKNSCFESESSIRKRKEIIQKKILVFLDEKKIGHTDLNEVGAILVDGVYQEKKIAIFLSILQGMWSMCLYPLKVAFYREFIIPKSGYYPYKLFQNEKEVLNEILLFQRK